MTNASNSHSDLTELKDYYEGERIFVIGNGPSLSETPLDSLDSEYTFALNRVNHIYEKVDWRPDFYLFLNNTMNDEEQQFIEENIDIGSTCFINEKYTSEFGDRSNVYYIKRKKLQADPLTVATNGRMDIDSVTTDKLLDVWSTDIGEGVYKKHSMYPTLQIAAYLGFDEFYLLGCDLGFDVQKPYMLFESGLDPEQYRDKRDFLSTALDERTPFRLQCSIARKASA